MIQPFTAAAEILRPGELIETEENVQKDRKHLSFRCETEAFGDGKILIGHGYQKTYGSWLEITAEYVAAYSYYSYRDPAESVILAPVPHGLQIKDFVSVAIDVDVTLGGAAITVCSSSGMYKTARIAAWHGWNPALVASTPLTPPYVPPLTWQV